MSLGEFDIIARYFASHDHRADVLLGVGDDAAVLTTRADSRLVVAIDTIVEGVHFPRSIDASAVGYRAPRRESQRHRRNGRRAFMDDAVAVAAGSE
jgi:thiamine-monophosphate kinase